MAFCILSFMSVITDSLQRTQLVDSIMPGSGNLVVVMGTGVSLQTAGYPDQPGGTVAGWAGLLLNGVEYCRRYNLIDTEYSDIVQQQIESGETGNLIAAAQTVRDWLDKGVNRREHWINESIGSLKVHDHKLISTIRMLGGLMTTINYDDFPQQVIPLSKTNRYKVCERSVCLSVQPPIANQIPCTNWFFPIRAQRFSQFFFHGIQCLENPIADLIFGNIP